MRRQLGLIALFLLPIAVLLGLGAYGYRQIHAPLPVPEPIVIDIPAGKSLSQVASLLEDRGVLPHPKLFSWYGRLRGHAARVKAGEYELTPGTSAAGLLQQLVAGRVRLHSLTIIEGWTFRDMLAAVRAHPAVRVVLDPEDQRIMQALDVEHSHPEGLFFPDTYHFPKGTTDREILTQAHRKLTEKLAAAWAKRADDLPLETPYDALILASIVEKETSLEEERPRVAGVFTRRLRLGMRLQTDPTVIYGLGQSFDGDIRHRDLAHDTPYNTYTRGGLPPTPISLPGAASIEAVMQPEEGDALYFVATGEEDGSHYFSATLEEHNRAVKKYLARLREKR